MKMLKLSLYETRILPCEYFTASLPPSICIGVHVKKLKFNASTVFVYFVGHLNVRKTYLAVKCISAIIMQ